MSQDLYNIVVIVFLIVRLWLLSTILIKPALEFGAALARATLDNVEPEDYDWVSNAYLVYGAAIVAATWFILIIGPIDLHLGWIL